MHQKLEHRKAAYLKTHPDSELKDLNGSELIWDVRIKFGKMIFETLFRGRGLQQLVDAVHEFLGCKGDERDDWDFCSNVKWLSEPLNSACHLDILDEDGMCTCGVDWNNLDNQVENPDYLELNNFIRFGDVINVELYPKAYRYYRLQAAGHLIKYDLLDSFYL